MANTPEEYLEELKKKEELEALSYIESGKKEGKLGTAANILSTPSDILKVAVSESGATIPEMMHYAANPSEVRTGVPTWKEILEKQVGTPGSWGKEKYLTATPEEGNVIAERERISGVPAPSTILGGVMDVAADPTNLIPAVASVKYVAPAIQGIAKSKSLVAIERSLAPYIKMTDYASENVNPKVLSNRIYEMGLTKDLSDAEKMRQKVGGLEGVNVMATEAGKLINKNINRGTGLVADYADKLQQTIDQVSPSVGKINRVGLASELSNAAMAEEISPMSTSIPGGAAKKTEMYKNILKIGADDVSLSELQQLKRDNAARLNSKDFVKASQADANLALEREARVDVDRYLKNKIRDYIPENATVSLGGADVNARQSFDVNNQIQHHLLQIRESLEPAALESMKSSGKIGTILPIGVGGATGAAVGSLVGSPYATIAGATLGASAAARGVAGRGIQPMLARGYESMAKSPKTMKALTGLSTALGIEGIQKLTENYGRKPQSIEEVAYMKIPRSTEAAIASPELLIEKVKQLDPSSLPIVQHAINEEPERLPDLMFALSQQFPQAFDNDKYGRFDGKIPSVTMMNYISDLRNDGSISNTEKAKIMNDVLKKKQSLYTPQ